MQDLTNEDQVQLSGNGKEASGDSYLQAIEEIEAFYQYLNEKYKAGTPAAPEPELYVPMTDHDENSQKESIQNQVMYPLKPTMMISTCSNIPGQFLSRTKITPC